MPLCRKSQKSMASSSSEVHRSVPFGMLGIVGALWSTAEEMRWAFSRADVVPDVCSARIHCQRLRTQMLMNERTRAVPLSAAMSVRAWSIGLGPWASTLSRDTPRAAE